MSAVTRRARGWRQLTYIALMILLGGSLAPFVSLAPAAGANETPNVQAQFELKASAPYDFEVRCPRQIMLIHWRTAREQAVDIFKVHRQAVGDGESGEWVNSIPLVAQGDNSSYTVADAQAQDGRDALYTLYGFVAADGYEEPVYLLSDALAVGLGDAVQPVCVHLPLIVR